MLVTVKGLRYQKLNEQAFRYGQVFLKRAFKSTLMFQQPQLKSRSFREYVNLLPLLPSGTNGLLSISCPNFNMDHVVTLFLCLKLQDHNFPLSVKGKLTSDNSYRHAVL